MGGKQCCEQRSTRRHGLRGEETCCGAGLLGDEWIWLWLWLWIMVLAGPQSPRAHAPCKSTFAHGAQIMMHASVGRCARREVSGQEQHASASSGIQLGAAAVSPGYRDGTGVVGRRMDEGSARQQANHGCL